MKKRSSKCHVVGFWKRGFRRASPGMGRGFVLSQVSKQRPQAMFPPVSGMMGSRGRQGSYSHSTAEPLQGKVGGI